MVSEFLCECHGRLSLSDDDQMSYPFFPSEATVIIKPGAGSKYWENKDLVDHVKKSYSYIQSSASKF